MWSRFKDGGDVREAEAAFILMQREEERKGVKDPIFTEWWEGSKEKESCVLPSQNCRWEQSYFLKDAVAAS